TADDARFRWANSQLHLDIPLSVRRITEETVLRRHAQEDRVPGVGTCGQRRLLIRRLAAGMELRFHGRSCLVGISQALTFRPSLRLKAADVQVLDGGCTT